MSGTKISALPSATTPLAGTELVPVVQDGETRAVAASEFGGGGGGAVDSVFGRTGVVVAEAGDYAVADITGLQTALDGKQALDATLTALAGLTYTSGRLVLELTSADTFTLRPVGAAASTDVIDRAAGDGRYLALSGGTLTGNFTVSKTDPRFIMQSSSGATNRLLVGAASDGSYRWSMDFGDATAETGGNVGSGFAVNRYSDAGAYLSTPIFIPRDTGKVYFQNFAPAVPAPTWVDEATNKEYVDDADALLAPKGPVTGAGLTMATARLLGRTTASTGAVEEISVGSGLSLTGGELSATGGGVSDGDKGDITVSASGATWTIDAGAVTLAKQANVATARIMGRVTAGTGVQEALTGTQATTLLDTFTTSLKGLAPASGGGTTNFLRADGTWAAPGGGGGGSPGGSANEVQYNDGAGGFAGAADVEIEGGQLRLPAISTPTVPSAGGLKMFGRTISNRVMPAFMGPSGLDTAVQPLLGRNRVAAVWPQGNGTVLAAWGITLTATGTATAANVATTNTHTWMKRLDYLVTTAATTAVAGWRYSAAQFGRGNAAGRGGFTFICRWGPATGVATATNRAFVGMTNSTAAPTDVNPSTLTNMFGMGWDAADSNIQFMHNDGAGAATKIDLGASFPRPTADRTEAYELAMFCAPNGSEIHYEVTNLATGAAATGTVSTDIPSTTTLVAPRGWMSVGGTSSVIGITLMGLYIETDL